MQISKQKTTFNSNNINPFRHFPPLDICFLSNNIMDYHIVSQGKTTIPSVDDGEEMGFTDVSNQRHLKNGQLLLSLPVFSVLLLFR